VPGSAKLRARATVICLREGNVLLVRKSGGKWNFPGGAIEQGELPVHAAAREMSEETGLDCEALLELCTLEEGSVLHHIFTTQLFEGAKPAPGNEIVACKWVKRVALKKTQLNPSASALMARALPALMA